MVHWYEMGQEIWLCKLNSSFIFAFKDPMRRNFPPEDIPSFKIVLVGEFYYSTLNMILASNDTESE